MEVHVNSYIEYVLRDDVRKQSAVILRQVILGQDSERLSEQEQVDAIVAACDVSLMYVTHQLPEDVNKALRIHLLKYVALLYSEVADSVLHVPEKIRNLSELADYYVLVLNNMAEMLEDDSEGEDDED